MVQINGSCEGGTTAIKHGRLWKSAGSPGCHAAPRLPPSPSFMPFAFSFPLMPEVHNSHRSARASATTAQQAGGGRRLTYSTEELHSSDAQVSQQQTHPSSTPGGGGGVINTPVLYYHTVKARLKNIRLQEATRPQAPGPTRTLAGHFLSTPEPDARRS